eukprot:4468100-Pyramimonas_sp.AAC.1
MKTDVVSESRIAEHACKHDSNTGTERDSFRAPEQNGRGKGSQYLSPRRVSRNMKAGCKRRDRQGCIPF